MLEILFIIFNLFSLLVILITINIHFLILNKMEKILFLDYIQELLLISPFIHNYKDMEEDINLKLFFLTLHYYIIYII